MPRQLQPIAICYPRNDIDRTRLVKRFPTCILQPLYADGIDKACSKCEMPLDVRPEIASSGVAVLCPECFVVEINLAVAKGEADTVRLLQFTPRE